MLIGPSMAVMCGGDHVIENITVIFRCEMVIPRKVEKDHWLVARTSTLQQNLWNAWFKPSFHMNVKEENYD